MRDRERQAACGAAQMPLNPEPGILEPAAVRRARWRCRRGMLELDLVLGRFVERHYAALDCAQRAAFDALLDMTDVALWDMITGNSPLPHEKAQAALLVLLRTA